MSSYTPTVFLHRDEIESIDERISLGSRAMYGGVEHVVVAVDSVKQTAGLMPLEQYEAVRTGGEA